ncbi:hypothetical protein Tco_0015216 [Tanacetum coccineum]
MDPVIRLQTFLGPHDPSMGFLFHFSRRSIHFYRLSHSELDDIEKMAVRSSLLLPKTNNAQIESRAMRSSINLVRTLFQYTCVSHTVKTRIILRVLRIILVILPEHPSDTKDYIKMEMQMPRSNIQHSFCNSDKYYHDPEECKLKKRKPDDADRDEGLPARPDQGLKRKKTGKDTKPSKKAKSTGTSKGTTKSQPKSTGKSAQAEKTVFEAGDTQVPEDLREDMGNTDEPPVVKADPKDWFKKPERPPTPDPEWNECKTVDRPAYKLLKGTCRSYVELEYNMEECYKSLNDQLDWNNPVGDRYPFDLSKQLPLVQSRNCQIVPVDYFFNNDLAYLQGGSIGRTYTTSLIKTKAAKYDLQGIKYMVPNLWSLVKVAYNRHALLGTSHWRSKRQTFYGYASNRVSKHDVYPTKRILAVTNVKVNVWYGYGHLEEIEVRRSNQQLYMFMEGDFPRLHINDIEDMLILVKRVEVLQLGVQSYQKKLNISNKLERNRLMCSHELYKFSDGTLISVWDKLKDMLNNLKMGYTSVMPRRRWINLDKKRSRIMVKDIDCQLLEREACKSLLVEGNTGKTLDCFSRQYDIVIFCSTISGQTS